MRAGQYSVSINARGKGGKILTNIEEALLHASMTPSQHLRHVFETAGSYSDAVAGLSAGTEHMTHAPSRQSCIAAARACQSASMAARRAT